MVTITRLQASAENFSDQLNNLLAWSTLSDKSVTSTVNEILNSVKKDGDKALISWSQQLDRNTIKNASEFLISTQRLQEALNTIDPEQKQALETAADRIRRYHEHQQQSDWQYTEDDGTVLGQKITALAKVGIYVPGGKAAYPSTILMTAIPAKVAGVNEIIVVTPSPDGKIEPIVLAAAAVAGVDTLYTIGGAQAIAALAYGTETIPKVDKIVGPGNIYVATAKRAVFGEVGLDMVAGPSEILIICDGKTDPQWIAMDLLSQAEHDENAQAILISDDSNFLNEVEKALKELLPSLERKEIASASLTQRAAFISVDDLQQAAVICNRIAPEHLELSIEDPEALLPAINNAGAIFMGRYTSESLGDYVAGPSHVLPTSTTARFSSPLGVYDFQKRSSIIYCSKEGASTLGKIASVLARGEKLTAHARSAELRITKDV